MRLLLVSGVGLFFWLIKGLRQKQFKKQDWYVVWLGVIAGAYFLAVTLWDWRFRRAYGFSFGLQGRYFFPTIVAHMVLIMMGLMNLIPKTLKYSAVVLRKIPPASQRGEPNPSLIKRGNPSLLQREARRDFGTKLVMFTLCFWWVTLSFIGLWTVITAYYQLWPLQRLWWQVSQYKPFWFKAEWWFVWAGLFGIAMTGLIMSLIRELLNKKRT